MRLAVSNIAWPAEADDEAAAVLAACGAGGVEIAPTKVWPRPTEASADSVAAYRRRWEDRGLPIAAMQALLFGRDDLTLFADPATRTRTADYLRLIIDLAAGLGATALVFGSPKNRARGELSQSEAEAIAVPLFRDLGRHAAARGVEFCIEPNPTQYRCDFVTTSAEAAAFVSKVDQDGFGLHLDVGGMTLAGEDPQQTFADAGGRWRHLHVSEPFLTPIGSGDTDHAAVAAALGRSGFGGWVSIEMREATGETGWREPLAQSIRLVRATYGT